MNQLTDAGLHRDEEPVPQQVLREEVLRELDQILKSTSFRKSPRGRQFLSYVVEQKLNGREDDLKERTIGVEVFQRAPGYATGDDPVVRVQASDVRRRLEQYHQANSNSGPVRIDLPVGSYCPSFQRPTVNQQLAPAVDQNQDLVAAPRRPHQQPMIFWIVSALCSILAFVAGLAIMKLKSPVHHESVLNQFWGPVFNTQQPVLICLARPVGYRPSAALYERYAASHPGTFQSEDDRWNIPLPLDGKEKLVWSDIDIVNGGVEDGDVFAAIKLSAVLVQIGKPSQVRIGTAYSFEDLRNSPAVVIGAFDSKWTMRLVSNLRFAYVEEGGQTFIREQIPGGRSWHFRSAQSQQPGADYAIVGRLMDSKTGQFDIVAGGITSQGTETSGEFLSSPEYLRQGLRAAPSDWQNRSSLFVLETTITDNIAGPPHVVASYFW
jgi:hypothetical protein